ncbi:MAG: hypothetical protein HQM11_05730 [SAR324 cluster bacterium]|nr:hypothetical protein [SAR324 cluster bacterium]
MKHHTPSWPQFHFFYKILLCVLFFAGAARMTHAINLNAVYFGSCQREVGIILNVDEESIDLLTIQGDIRNISRYEITYLAYYPIGLIPVSKIHNAAEVPMIQIQTLFRNQIVDLVEGWAVDFSEDKISFLTPKGEETVIEKSNIWKLTKVTQPNEIILEKGISANFQFLHPYPFSHCRYETGDSHQTIYPQQLLGEPLLIKKELDHLMEGHQIMSRYEKNQKFYPVPQVYKNDTILGLWFNAGSRYGASSNRVNNFTPVLSSELSAGPFGFQRIFITGSAPMPYSLHEEPQTQFYYRLKADYAHFSFMYDISRLLIGEERFKWSERELGPHDGRMTEIMHIGGGLDYGSYSIDVSLPQIQYAVRHKHLFFAHRMSVERYGIFYHNRLFKMDLYFGSGEDKKEEIFISDEDSPALVAEKLDLQARQFEFLTRLKTARMNILFHFLDTWKPMYSLIYTNLDFSREPSPYEQDLPYEETHGFKFKSSSWTQAFYADVPLGYDLSLHLFVSAEYFQSESGQIRTEKHSGEWFPKTGTSLALTF